MSLAVGGIRRGGRDGTDSAVDGIRRDGQDCMGLDRIHRRGAPDGRAVAVDNNRRCRD